MYKAVPNSKPQKFSIICTQCGEEIHQIGPKELRENIAQGYDGKDYHQDCWLGNGGDRYPDFFYAQKNSPVEIGFVMEAYEEEIAMAKNLIFLDRVVTVKYLEFSYKGW